MIRRIAVISFSCAILTVSQACAEMSDMGLLTRNPTSSKAGTADGGIGKVGNPNMPSTPAPADMVQPPAATTTVAPAPVAVTPTAPLVSPNQAPVGKPLLVIRFNQNHVYFAHALQLAIKNAENAKAGIAYNVVNYVPEGGTRAVIERRNDMAAQNLRAVINEMQNQGVDASRISQTTLPAGPDMHNQEVDIFVK